MNLDLLDTSLRHATFAQLTAALESQHTAKYDVVTSASALTSEGGTLRLPRGYSRVDEQGVFTADALLTPTAVAEAAIGGKLKIPADYLRRCREADVELYDHNVNAWLRREPDRPFLLRGLVDHSGSGYLRAFLSDEYGFIDHLDVLTASLEGIEAAGADVTISQADLSERRMYVAVRSRSVAAMAPELLRDYRSPFTGARGSQNPTVFAGFVISNSETGHGACTITPRLTVEICSNGATFDAFRERRVHTGRKLDAGVVRWSQDTQRASLDLVRAMTRDTVRTFLSDRFLHDRIDEMTAAAGVAIRDPQPVIEHVGSQLELSADARAAIFRRFIEGADSSSGGVLHAVTAAAQDMSDADEAYDLESAGLKAMQTAAAFARTH